MARGNWRSGEGHGPAEVGSARKIIDGYMMKRSGAFPTRKEADRHAEDLRTVWNLRTSVVEAPRAKVNKFVVWRTFRRNQKQYEPDVLYDNKTGERLR
jgi:hypothetical protein